jgi:FkbM family methyltransferase
MDRFGDWIEEVCGSRPAVYLDVGAGDGFDCEVIAERFPSLRAIAIDPVEEFVCSDRVETYRAVIGQPASQRPFYVKAIPGIHGIYSRPVVDTVEVLTLPVVTLDAFVGLLGITRVDAMKIDVEGAAWDVLQGAHHVLQTVRAVHIETEWLELFTGQRVEADVFPLLTAAGLECVWTHRVEDLGQGDTIWVRKNACGVSN